MAVYKTVIVVTVLSDVPLEGDLADIAREIDTGDSIGHVEMGSHQLVQYYDVKPMLLAMGNDGTFFDYLDEDEETE